MLDSRKPLNRKISLFLLFLIFFSSFVSLMMLKTRLLEKQRIEDYRKALFSFQQYEVEDVLIKLKNKKNILLFVGRESCPYCVEFLPHLVDLLQNNDTIHTVDFECVYIDSTDSRSNLLLTAFRTKYLIDSVPAVLVFSDGEYEKIELLKEDSSYDYQNLEQKLSTCLNYKEE